VAEKYRTQAIKITSAERFALVGVNPEDLYLVFEPPELDVSALLRSKKLQIITGVSFFTDKRQYHFFDAESLKAPLLVAQGANDPRVQKA